MPGCFYAKIRAFDGRFLIVVSACSIWKKAAQLLLIFSQCKTTHKLL